MLAFLDDILVLGTTFEEHLKNLEEVFKHFKEYQLNLKPRKYTLFKESVEFRGRVVSQRGLEISPQHLKPVKYWPIRTCTKDVEKFLGFANYHRLFFEKLCQNFSTTV